MATSLGFSLGTKIGGKYEILDTLGVGGMGVVYKVREQVGAVGRIRALKTILPQHIQNQDMRNRFREEAEKMCLLEHENIVPVLNYSEEGDLPFIVMPFIEGHTLKDYLSRHLKDNGTGLPLPQVLEIGVQVALGLEVAHRFVNPSTGRMQPIIHRDIKPGNIMVRADDRDGEHRLRVLIMDFGIAKLKAEEDTGMSLTGVIGTVKYAAPEQVQRLKTVDPRADIYSLGMVLYELYCGRHVFADVSEHAVLMRLMQHDVEENEPQFQRAAPESFRELVRRCIAVDPARRFASVSDLHPAMRRILEDEARARLGEVRGSAEVAMKARVAALRRRLDLLAPKALAEGDALIARAEQAEEGGEFTTAMQLFEEAAGAFERGAEAAERHAEQQRLPERAGAPAPPPPLPRPVEQARARAALLEAANVEPEAPAIALPSSLVESAAKDPAPQGAPVAGVPRPAPGRRFAVGASIGGAVLVLLIALGIWLRPSSPPPPTSSPPVEPSVAVSGILPAPGSVSIPYGGEQLFTAKVTAGDPSLLHWSVDGRPAAGGARFALKEDVTEAPGAHRVTLTSAATGLSADWQVEVEKPPLQFAVVEPPTEKPLEREPGSVSFEASVKGKLASKVAYHWQVNQRPVSDTGPTFRLDAKDVGPYDVRVRAEAPWGDRTEASWRVVVKGPPPVEPALEVASLQPEPGALSLTLDEQKSFLVKLAAGDSALLQWEVDGRPGSRGSSFTLKEDVTGAPGSHRVALTSTGTGTAKRLGEWQVDVVAPALAWDAVAPPSDKPLELDAGTKTASFEAPIRGKVAEKIAYQWYVNQELVPGANRPSHELAVADGGKYDVRVRATAPWGKTIDRSWKVAVGTVEKPPVDYEREIALWVKDYCGAFERKDVDRLASLGQYKTTDDQEAARKALDKLGDLKVSCSQPSISLAGTQATVAFDRTDTVTDPSGRVQKLARKISGLMIRRDDRGWVISLSR